ncbi:hypothetical protein Asppvi_007850 [Aspergillus pseudoviridinutans]|uniref:Methyltransferase type 11 domain-containing protein n=1 Tax=Aspergillus pseudoviridinutans TaxID=1517512 RepID=A0A9P3BCL3_9EURO|nr:uncharacterized protein Asppvi_007850 [Aspergillus pseudoviridinutans]GIJ88922.1 hypothetical protein Asppvi_007850 [Aspergillus pseudoviridinutans]
MSQSIYSSSIPENHIERLSTELDAHDIPSKPSYGIDSPLGLIASNILSPLYLYATTKGKFQVWDDLLANLPRETFRSPTLDLGCGRGMVLLKIAQIKKQLNSSESPVHPAYGIDLFVKGDQSGNSPLATYKNTAALGVCEQTVLHSGSFAELPFSDGVFSLVTASLSIHNADKATRKQAIGEAARVLMSGGYLVVVDMAGYVSEYLNTVKEMGWMDVSNSRGHQTETHSRPPDYDIMDGNQGVGVAVLAMSPDLINAESKPLMGSDDTTLGNHPPFRASEDTAVSLGSYFTVETFDGASAAVQTK